MHARYTCFELLERRFLGDGKEKGSMTATYIPDAQVSADVPKAQKPTPKSDGGVDAGQ
jgi:hypothetical protein